MAKKAPTEEQRRKEIEEGLKKKRDCEAKALSIVQQLIDNSKDRQWIRESLGHIMPGDYDDIIEERTTADVKLCGYPLCHEPHDPTKCKQKYHINIKTKQVIDLEKRKNFCSTKCFQASCFLRDKLSSTPLWLRKESDIPEIIFKDEIEPHESAKVEKSEDKDEASKPKVQPKIKREKKKPVNEAKNIDQILDVIKEWWTPNTISYINGLDFEVEKVTIEVNEAIKENEDVKKVEAYFAGSTEIQTGQVLEKDTSKATPILPLIDKNAQVILRQKVSLQGLENGHNAVAEILELNWIDVSDDLKKLVATFHLTPENIVMRPNEWMMTYCILCMILSRKDEKIRGILERPTPRAFLDNLFLKLGRNSEQMSAFIKHLMENKTS